MPATGFVSSIIPTFSRRPIFGYTAMVLAMTSIGFIGFGVWVHHMFATPLPELGQAMFTASSMMIVIPSGVQIFCWLATLFGGRPKLRSPLLWVYGFFAIFILGGMTGVILASVSLDLQAHDTHFVVAHLHYVLIGGAVFPLMGAIAYWFPKITGKFLSERLGYLSFSLMFVGFNLTFYPLHHLGMRGMTRRIYTYLPETGWGSLNFLATVGAYLMGVGVTVFVINVIKSRWRGEPAGPNPWGAGTLEWATISPPPSYNWSAPPTVQGANPVWDNPADSPVIVGLVGERRTVLCTTILEASPHHRYSMAGDSIWPLLVAMSVAICLIGGMFHPVWTPLGCILLTAFLYAWFWASGERKNLDD